MTAPRAVAACVGKVAFDSWEQAEKRAKRRRRSGDLTVHPYRCRMCGKVHLGGGEAVRHVRKLQRSMAKYEAPKD